MSEIIGIDHGNGLMKTVRAVFGTSVTESKGAPPIDAKMAVRLGETYYACGDGKGTLKENKTVDQTYWHLTLAAIMEELKARRTEAGEEMHGGTLNVVIGAGIPLECRDDAKYIKDFAEYLTRRDIEFWYEGDSYILNVDRAFVFRQGHSAILGRMEDVQKKPVLNVVDIGNGTVDAVKLMYGKRDRESVYSVKFGVNECIKAITKNIRRNLNMDIAREQIEAVLWKGDEGLPQHIRNEIARSVKGYVRKLTDILIAAGFDLEAIPTVFVGGGAILVQRYIKIEPLVPFEYIENINCNAVEYEKLAKIGLEAGK